MSDLVPIRNKILDILEGLVGAGKPLNKVFRHKPSVAELNKTPVAWIGWGSGLNETDNYGQDYLTINFNIFIVNLIDDNPEQSEITQITLMEKVRAEFAKRDNRENLGGVSNEARITDITNSISDEALLPKYLVTVLQLTTSKLINII